MTRTRVQFLVAVLALSATTAAVASAAGQNLTPGESPTTLTIQGTAGNDFIGILVSEKGQLVIRSTKAISPLDAPCFEQVTGKQFACPIKAFDRIEVSLLGGDDKIVVTGKVTQAMAIKAGSGKDRIFAGAAPDEIDGGAGKDLIFAGKGKDFVNGGADDDEIQGEEGDDSLAGGKGDDLIFGQAGIDTLNGGPGNDICSGGPAKDRFRHCEATS